MQTMKFKLQVMVAFYATVNHRSRPYQVLKVWCLTFADCRLIYNFPAKSCRVAPDTLLTRL